MTNPNEKNSEFSRVYEPYVIKTRQNDLNKINEKNLQRQEMKTMKAKTYNKTEFDPLGDKLEKEKPVTAQDFFNKKSPNMGLYG